jgi:MFS family permease
MKLKLANFSSDTFGSFRNYNFRLFFGGQAISQIGNWLTLIAQTLLVLKLTGSGVMVGLLVGCQFAPVLLLGAWGGLVADRSDKRKLLMGVQFFAMAQSFALALLAFMDHPPVAGIFAVAFAGGISTAFDNPARRAFVVEMVAEEHVNNAVSLNSAMMTGSRIIGPALAGLLITKVGYGWCFLLDGVSYVAVIAGYAAMRTGEFRRPDVAPKGKGQIREGLRYARSIPDLWVPLVMMALIGTLSFNFQVVIPLLVKQTFLPHASGHESDAAFTLLYAVISVGSLVGALATARRKEITLRHVIVGSAAFGVAMLVFAASPNLAASFPLGLLLGGTSIAFMTASTSIVQLRAEPKMRGRVLALQAIVFLGSTPIGGPILGVVCDWLSPRAGVALGGLAAVTAAAFGHLAARRRRGLEDREVDVDTPPMTGAELQTA